MEKNVMYTIELNPNHLWFKIEPEQKESAEQKVKNIDTYQYQSYLNQLASEIVLPYIQEEYPEASVTQFDYAQFWQFGVNGVAVDFDGKRLVLVPSDAYDIDELRISQEWVDIPELAADYYLAVQIDIEDSLMRIWGYTTHKELKETGTHYNRDRTYSITREQITEDINALWLMRSYFPDKQTKAAITPIPELSENELAPILDRLVNPEIRLLRRATPFLQWAYLFNSEKHRTELIVNRLIHSTLITYIRGTSEDKINEIRNKQFTNKELTEAAKDLNKIFRTKKEDEYSWDGEEVLSDLLGLNADEELAFAKRGGGTYSDPRLDDIRLDEDDDEEYLYDEELASTRRGGGIYSDPRLNEDDDEEYLEDEPDLLDLARDLFDKLKGIWSKDETQNSY